MNDRPEQWDWTEPVQDEISPEDLTMIVQEMKKAPDNEADRVHRLAAMKELQALVHDRANDVICQEPVQDEMSAEDLAMIVQELKKEPGYAAGRARRIAAINKYRNYLLSIGPVPTNRFKLIRDEDDEDC